MDVSQAIRDHGEKSFEFTVIEKDIPLAELDRKEAYYIDLFDSTNPLKGYNCRAGGIGGYQVLERTRKKLSEINKKRQAQKSPEERKAHMAYMRKIRDEKGPSPEFIEHCRQRMKGNTLRRGQKMVYKSEDTKRSKIEKTRAALLGKPKTEAHKQACRYGWAKRKARLALEANQLVQTINLN